MPISDTYIIQYLLDASSERQADIHWCEKNPDEAGYTACVEDVDVFLEPSYSRAGSRLILRFRQGGEEFSISEPASAGWLGRKFSPESERHLAALFRKLNAAVAAQCAHRRQRSADNRDEIRDRIGRRLLFGSTEKTRTDQNAAASRFI